MWAEPSPAELCRADGQIPQHVQELCVPPGTEPDGAPEKSAGRARTAGPRAAKPTNWDSEAIGARAMRQLGTSELDAPRAAPRRRRREAKPHVRQMGNSPLRRRCLGLDRNVRSW